MPKIVAVSGCLGFLGSHLVEALIEHGYRVYGLDNETYAANIDLLDTWRGFSDVFKYQKIDICELPHLPDVDAILNLAAETHVDNSLHDAERFVHSNFVGVHHLLELLRGKRAYQIPLFLQVSTDEVHGSIPEGTTTEDAPLAPSSPYAASKAAAELLMRSYGCSFQIPWRMVRPSNLYGTRQHHEKLIPKAIRHLVLGRPIPIHEGGNAVRNWLDVKDCAQAILTVLEHGTNSQIYNIGGNTELSVAGVVAAIIQAFHGSAVTPTQYMDFGYTRLGLDRRYCVSDEKLRSLGWTPQGDLLRDIPNLVAQERHAVRW